MKKTILFASVMAMVAIFAASCGPKVDPPKALFSYSVDELVVTFQNLSTEAVSYVWNFGDGTTDTAANPVHEYADYGDYTVTLTATNAGGSNTYEDEVNLVQRAVVVDGDFSDWAALKKVAICEKTDNSTYDYLYNAKLVRDEDFIYFYLEFDNEQDDFDTEEGPVHGYYAQMIQFVLNCGDESTGCSVAWYFDDPAIDILIEGTWTDQFEGGSVFTCPEELNGQENDNWEWIDEGVFNSTTCCKAVKLANGHMAIEGKISVLKLPVKPADVLKMGVVTLDAGWSESGALPENSMATGQATPAKLIAVPAL